LNPEACCKLVINATGNVTIFGMSGNTQPSYFRFADTQIYSGGLITLGQLSNIDANGMGFLEGPGFINMQFGASYSAQSGFCDSGKSVPVTSTYGTYFQLHSDSNLTEQFGSGGGSLATLGGGRIVLLGKGLQLQGDLRAQGMPNSSAPQEVPIDGKSSPVLNQT
jgi:hypothetical protein